MNRQTRSSIREAEGTRKVRIAVVVGIDIATIIVMVMLRILITIIDITTILITTIIMTLVIISIISSSSSIIGVATRQITTITPLTYPSPRSW